LSIKHTEKRRGLSIKHTEKSMKKRLKTSIKPHITLYMPP